MNCYQLFKELLLAVLSFNHKVSYQGFLSCIESCFEDIRHAKNFTGVIDPRNAELDFTPFEIKELGSYICKKQCQEGHWAILVDSPLNTALSTLYSNAFTGNHEVKLFSCIEGISNYMGYSLQTILEKNLNQIPYSKERKNSSKQKIYKDQSNIIGAE